MAANQQILVGLCVLAVVVLALCLPALAKKGDPPSTFVGSMGQHPFLVPCAFPQTSSWMMNRCSYS